MPHDPRFVHNHASTESIATSGGQNDSGLFVLDFNDERYLPFEYAGAVSRWRIELPPENNQFELNMLSDLVVHLSYTAREGGDALRQAAKQATEQHLPAGGWRLFDIRHEFPDAWEVFQPAFQRTSHKYTDHRRGQRPTRDFQLQLTRNMFPFISGGRVITVVSLSLFIEVCSAEVGEYIKVKYYAPGHKFDGVEDECCTDDVREFDCVMTREWPGLYHGTLKVKLGPIYGSELHGFGMLRYPEHISDISETYMLCRFEAGSNEECKRPAHLQQHRKVWGHHQWMEGL